MYRFQDAFFKAEERSSWLEGLYSSLALVVAKLHSLYQKVLLFLPESQLPEGADNSAKP